MTGTNYAYIEERSAWLSTEFGEKLARKYFGSQVDDLPRYVRGKRKGQLKGQFNWMKVEKGGWVHGFHSPVFGHIKGKGVENRKGKIIRAMLTIPVWGGQDEVIALYVRDGSELEPLDRYHLKERGVKLFEANEADPYYGISLMDQEQPVKDPQSKLDMN